MARRDAVVDALGSNSTGLDGKTNPLVISPENMNTEELNAIKQALSRIEQIMSVGLEKFESTLNK